MLVAARERTDVRVNLSIGTLDSDVWRATEPGTPHPRRRLEAVAALNEAGIPCGVLVAPILPGLSDGREQLEAVATACVEAGAVSVSAILLHLRPGVKQHYLETLRASPPPSRPSGPSASTRGPTPRRRTSAASRRSCTQRSGGPVGAAPSRARASTSPATSTPQPVPEPARRAPPPTAARARPLNRGWQCGGMEAPDTVTEATRMLESEGYTATVTLIDGGVLRFSDVDTPCGLEEAVVERMYRFEGDSDPGDEMVVFGLRFPARDARGTLVSAFGLAADPEVMQHLTYIASKVENP